MLPSPRQIIQIILNLRDFASVRVTDLCLIKTAFGDLLIFAFLLNREFHLINASAMFCALGVGSQMK